jgi:uncharacterized membrane protein YidH (DUF202 family)
VAFHLLSNLAAAMLQNIPTLRVHILEDGTDFSLALFEGAEPSALSHAVSARLPFALDSSFYCTATADPYGVVVPLTTKLPDGIELTVHKGMSAMLAGYNTRPSRITYPAGTTDVQVAHSCHQYLQEPQEKLVGPRAPLLQQEPTSHHAGSSDTKEAASGCERLQRAESQEEIATGADEEAEGGASRGRKRNSPLQHFRRRLSLSPSGSRTSLDVAHEDSATNEVTRHMCDSMERFSRLSSDLANERTFLAWVRTALAAIRTVFAFYAMAAVDGLWLWNGALVSSQVAMVAVVIISLLLGNSRYRQVKDVIARKVPPLDFGRLSIRWLFTILFLISCTTAVCIAARQWERHE